MRRRRWPARVLTLAYACAVVAATAVVADSYTGRPRRFGIAWRSLYAAELSHGQLQLTRARVLLARQTGTLDGNPTFALAQDPWDRQLDASLPRVVTDPWPPLWNDASVFVGGNVASYVASTGGTTRFEFLESGMHVDVRGMSAWLALGLIALPLAPLARLTLRKAERLGHCAACGFDLRASPDRCPECGRITPAIAGGYDSPA